MIADYHAHALTPFENSTHHFEALVERLSGTKAKVLPHGALEEVIAGEGRELMRLLLEDHLALRSHEERRSERVVPVAADEIPRERARDSSRSLRSVFGDVRVHRLSWIAPGVPGLHPMDAELNLTGDLYSIGVRRLVAQKAVRCSYDMVIEELSGELGKPVPKRQVLQLALRAAEDFDAFYDGREGITPCEGDDLVLMSFDGKGVVMRLEGLRPSTRAAAEKGKHKLRHRLSRGEKANRKRMAAVAAVWTSSTDARTVDDIVREPAAGSTSPRPRPRRRPRARNKRVWAHLDRPMASVIDEAFVEALRRDPDKSRTWVVLVDGDKSLRRQVERAARKHGVDVVLVLDIVHVLEYLWKAGWALFGKEDPKAEGWVTERLRRLLRGQVSGVAAGMRRSATLRKVTGTRREAVDRCANYLLKRKGMARYDDYLASGYPIATGVIEGACRHLIKDRMDITGARWGLEGAESILRLRALRSSGDFDEYWLFHQRQEYDRNHRPLYDTAHCPPLRLVA
jgi:hypothetical protein